MNFDDLMRQAGLDAIADKESRAAAGQEMTSPEQDRYHAACYFAWLVSKAARVQSLRDAAIRAVIHSQYPIETDYGRGYDKARKDAADAIRLLGEDAGKPVECTTCGALVVGVAPAWKDVRTHGLPPCDGETVYVGENEAGYLGCFNELADGGHCLMQTPEGCDVVMSELRFWRVQDRPDGRLLGEDAGRGES